jgi:Mn-containing catalase
LTSIVSATCCAPQKNDVKRRKGPDRRAPRYERLINFCRDAGTKDALQFLMTREITHMKAFTAALESMGKPAFSFGRIAPTAGLVNQFFNDSDLNEREASV